MLDPGTTSWPGAIPVVAVALILLFLPGLMVARPLRTPWLASFAVAPGLSTTALVLITVTSSAIGVPWGPVPLIAGVLALWLIAALLGLLLRRRTPREKRSRLPIATLVATAIAAAGVTLVLVPVSLTPEAFPQHPDTLFHLGVTQWMVEHQDASFLHAEAFRGSGPGPYQAAFHSMVATITQLSGASVVVSASSFVLVIVGVVWPLGCIFLARTLFGPTLAVTLSAGVVSVAFSSYPFKLMGFGVLWPNLFGMTLLPAALALLAVMVSAANRRSQPLTSRLRATVLLLATLPGLAVAHPNALVTFFMFGYLMVAGLVLGKSWGMRRDRPRSSATAVVGLVVATGLAFVVSTRLEFKGGMRTRIAPNPVLSPGKAVHDMLLFAQNDATELPVLAVLVAVGAGIVLVRHRGSRWLVAALIITDALFYLRVAVDNPAALLFSWPWDNEPVRLATLVVLPAILLATVALATGARFLKTRVGLSRRASAFALPLLFVITTGGAYINAHRSVLETYFHPPPSMSWASDEELRALHRLGQTIPMDAVVAENPWNGGGYMYIVSGRTMLFPTESDLSLGDRTLLATRLDDAGTAPLVCAAARRQHVRFAITGGLAFGTATWRHLQFAGVDAVGSSDAFRKIAKEGPFTLYQMIKCAGG